MKTYVLKVEPFTKVDEPKAQALKPLEEAAELRDSARKVYASNVERGRYEPY